VSFVQLPETPIIGRNLVGGEWITPTGAEMLDVRSPYTGAVIGRIPMTPASGVAPAVEAA
jgi:malonate-semialdehyde dehydrogenase (acetylating)/methylmalonate-semialdehyde dehydrogenase